MQGWIADDADGRSFLLRSGTGRVAAVVPVGSADEHGNLPFHTVEIDVDPLAGRARAIRLSTRGRVSDGDALHQEALASLSDQVPIAWSIAWHRHSWVPDEVPITSLNLQSDTLAWLVALERIESAEALDSNAQVQGGTEHE